MVEACVGAEVGGLEEEADPFVEALREVDERLQNAVAPLDITKERRSKTSTLQEGTHTDRMKVWSRDPLPPTRGLDEDSDELEVEVRIGEGRLDDDDDEAVVGVEARVLARDLLDRWLAW